MKASDLDLTSKWTQSVNLQGLFFFFVFFLNSLTFYLTSLHGSHLKKIPI